LIWPGSSRARSLADDNDHQQSLIQHQINAIAGPSPQPSALTCWCRHGGLSLMGSAFQPDQAAESGLTIDSQVVRRTIVDDVVAVLCS
tara:strand:- start:578 stop:841 length:264 start_codon:yes stop_codon:yes gene_type:complete